MPKINHMKRLLFIFVWLFTWMWTADGRPTGTGVPNVPANSDTLSYHTIQGTVRDEITRRPLPYVFISIEKSAIASVSNNEGNFVLKAPDSLKNAAVIFSHLGYKKIRLPLESLWQRTPLTIDMETMAYTLQDIVVQPFDEVTEMVLKAIKRIPENYGKTPVAMIGFYREFVKKNNTYLSIAEAVLDVRKAPYHTGQNDAARIYRGRKSADVNRADTVLFRLQGGILTTLLLDAAKNPEILFTEKPHEHYDFSFAEMAMIDEKPHYVIAFNQKSGQKDILFRGKMYLEPSSLAFARIEFNMNVEDRPEAAQLFVKRLPRGAKVTPVYATYTVNFRQQNGRWMYAYARSEVKFKSNFRKFLFFRPSCTIISEIAITDADEDGNIVIPRKEAVKLNDIVADQLSVFTGDEFWGHYNYIEPEQSIESAIEKMNRRLKRAGGRLDIELF